MTATNSAYIFDVKSDEFSTRVLDRSTEVPVVVDFWAPWCGPCRALTPVLVRAVEALGGRVLLAKVNTDEEPVLAQRYHISGIPAVKALRDGQVVDEFSGVRDLRFVNNFLLRLAPSPIGQALQQATRLLASGSAVEADALLRPLLGEAELVGEPRAQAQVLLAEALVKQGAGHHQEALTLLNEVDPRSEATTRAEALQRLLRFFAAATEIGGEEAALARIAARDSDWEARYGLAAALARRGAYEEALEALLVIVSRDRRFREDGALDAMRQIFDVLGPQSDLAAAMRHKLQVVT